MEYQYLDVYNGDRASLQDDVDLTVEVAESIRNFPGHLSIDDLNILPPEFVRALTEDFKGSSLTFFGDFDLAPEEAELLSHISHLSFQDLEKLSVAAASQLANHKGTYLGLNGIYTISEDLAAALSKHESKLGLNYVQEISEAACLELAKHRECVELDSLDPGTLTPTALAAFKKAWPDVWGNV